MADLSGIKTKPLLARVLDETWHVLTLMTGTLVLSEEEMATKDGRKFDGQVITMDIEMGDNEYPEETIPHWCKDGLLTLIQTEHSLDDVPDEIEVKYRREEDADGLNSGAWQWPSKKGRK